MVAAWNENGDLLDRFATVADAEAYFTLCFLPDECDALVIDEECEEHDGQPIDGCGGCAARDDREWRDTENSLNRWLDSQF